MRVGVLSPNVLFDITNHNAMADDPLSPWLFDSVAKKISLLFDKLFLTDNLDLTCQILGSTGLFDEGPARNDTTISNCEGFDTDAAGPWIRIRRLAD